MNILSTNGVFDPCKFLDTLNGAATCYLIKGAMSKAYREAVLRNFHSCTEKSVDNVYPPIAKFGISLYEYVGVFQNYFEMAMVTQDNIDGLYPPAGSYFDHIFQEVAEIYSQPVRPLQHDGLLGFYGVFREWYGNQGNLAALIHEDFLDPKSFHPLETTRLVNQLSIVVCFSNGYRGGVTRIYDFQPTQADYENQDLRDGYGFSSKLVEGIAYIDVKLSPGDVLIFDSTRLHSVSSVKISGPARVTAQLFCGFLDSDELIYWS